LDRPFDREFEDLINELPKDWWLRMEWAIREFGGINGEQGDKEYDYRE
jgi:hypothetical protein